MDQKVAIIGAGLAGSLLAIYLAKRGIGVDVYEARGDMRLEEVAAGRSINLALSDRGIAALREVGMDEYMLSEAVPMFGRMIHTVTGETRLQRYSGRDGEYINSVSREGLNIALINEAERYAQVRFHFNARCIDLDCRTGAASFASGLRVSPDTVIATDGAGSAVRTAMMHGGVERFDYSQVWLEHGYKELHIPSMSQLGSEVADGSVGNFRMEKNALHIWPRHKFMMIALPNFGGDFTCTLFLAHEGKDDAGSGFDAVTDSVQLHKFFEVNFPDAVPLMPNLEHDYFANPVGNLGTVKCYPWNAGGKALLLGDSAHAVVPFYGQGMNCAFEDVRILDQLIDKHGTNWEAVYDAYGPLRKPNTNAIADMAQDNFYEMRDAVADPVFVRKRQLETRLEHQYTDYFSKYSMVTFREDLPYAAAQSRGNLQDELLMEICRGIEDVDAVDLDALHARLTALP